MPQIPFDIKEIRVSESSIGSYELDVFLHNGMQMNSKFENKNQYKEAVAAKGNLTLLKEIFRDWINNTLKENPQFLYYYSDCELFDVSFEHIMIDPTESIEDKLTDSMELIRSCAIEKGIEFDGNQDNK